MSGRDVLHLPCQQLRSPAQKKAADHWLFPRHGRDVQTHRQRPLSLRLLYPGTGFKSLTGVGLQEILCFFYLAGSLYDMLHCLGIDFTLRIRQYIQADLVPYILLRKVRRVRAVGDPAIPQIPLDLLPGYAQQRADDLPSYRRDSGQSLKPASPEQIQQYSLRIIIHMMRHCYFIRMILPACLFKRLIAQFPSGFLHGLLSFPGDLSHTVTVFPKRDIIFLAEPLYISRVLLRILAADAVLHMNCRQRQRNLPADFHQRKKQAYGVRSSRYAYNYPVIGLQHVIFRDKFQYFLNHVPKLLLIL